MNFTSLSIAEVDRKFLFDAQFFKNCEELPEPIAFRNLVSTRINVETYEPIDGHYLAINSCQKIFFEKLGLKQERVEKEDFINLGGPSLTGFTDFTEDREVIYRSDALGYRFKVSSNVSDKTILVGLAFTEIKYDANTEIPLFSQNLTDHLQVFCNPSKRKFVTKSEVGSSNQFSADHCFNDAASSQSIHTVVRTFHTELSHWKYDDISLEIKHTSDTYPICGIEILSREEPLDSLQEAIELQDSNGNTLDMELLHDGMTLRLNLTESLKDGNIGFVMTTSDGESISTVTSRLFENNFTNGPILMALPCFFP